MMFIVALTICHLGHAAEPICVQENVKEANSLFVSGGGHPDAISP